MVDNKLQIHFQYNKRESFAGGVACFDHVDYIRTGRRDSGSENENQGDMEI